MSEAKKQPAIQPVGCLCEAVRDTIIRIVARSTVQCCMSAVAVLEFHLLRPSGMQPQPSVVMLVQRLSTAAARVTLALCWLEDLDVVMQIATC
eukprot:COSAG02_NODE_3330_length_6923_cov_14.113277_12_plen_93_part_00